MHSIDRIYTRKKSNLFIFVHNMIDEFQNVINYE